MLTNSINFTKNITNTKKIYILTHKTQNTCLLKSPWDLGLLEELLDQQGGPTTSGLPSGAPTTSGSSHQRKGEVYPLGSLHQSLYVACFRFSLFNSKYRICPKIENKLLLLLLLLLL